MKIYIAGPMRGIPDDNRPAFRAAAQLLRIKGHEVFSPAEHDESLGQEVGITDGRELKTQILWDLQCIAEADCVALLDGWIHSSGVRLELEMARFVGCRVMPINDLIGCSLDDYMDDLKRIQEFTNENPVKGK